MFGVWGSRIRFLKLHDPENRIREVQLVQRKLVSSQFDPAVLVGWRRNFVHRSLAYLPLNTRVSLNSLAVWVPHNLSKPSVYLPDPESVAGGWFYNKTNAFVTIPVAGYIKPVVFATIAVAGSIKRFFRMLFRTDTVKPMIF